MAITASHISDALKTLEIQEGTVLLVHSSLKSLGPVEGGADGVIAGLETVIGKEGTLVMPTLCQKDFLNSYKTWYRDKPSDVGYLTEYFRKQPYVYRSDHPTHSVAARGKLAYELTCEHSAFGPHLCPFGEYAFADSSPWLKMYRHGATILFIGVSLMYNTMKHTVEARYVENLLSQVSDAQKREALKQEVAVFGHFTGVEIWPMYDGQRMHAALDEAGLIRKARCGEAQLYCVDMKDSCDAAYRLLSESPETWCNEATWDWIQRCKAE